MAIVETFSKRQKKLKGEATDVFTYDEISQTLRVQISNILTKCLGIPTYPRTGSNNPAYKYLHDTLATEFGYFHFPKSLLGDAPALINFFTNDATTEQALDMIDVCFRFVIHFSSQNNQMVWSIEISSDEAIADLNTRFLEHGVGYAFIGGESPQLIRKDNEHLHADVVMPALRLLHEQGFSGANAEYRKAHEHYMRGQQKECLVECLKAFESTMKTICAKRKWPCKDTDTARTLIDNCLNNGLLPPFMQAHLGTVKSALESAIPTIRNKMGGHGQGEQPKDVPPFYAEYLLHETAATIVFLVDAYKALP
jgi:AbiJ N-terminal domain 4